MSLQEEYKEETNRESFDNIEGWKIFTNDYVEWLEAIINKYRNNNP